MKRPVRVANCSGALMDPGDHMHNQAKYGPVDVITGDYLAELNLATYAEAYAAGSNPGWIATAWDGIEKTVDLLHEKRIKLIINGGGLNPRGLAEKTHELVDQKGLDLKVAYVEGDDLLPRVNELLKKLVHLDGENTNVHVDGGTLPSDAAIVSANAYLGIRAIRRGLDEGADIIICGRVADASPVIAAAAWWHDWPETAFTPLAGALIAGHLIECSTYVTGANFAGFDRYDVDSLLNLGLPIAEIDVEGNCIVTKHENLPGIVTADTVECQLLYELQGNLYLNSDVKADITDIQIVQQGKNRVHVTGVRGSAPPPTTKLAIFYKGGFQAELLINACGLAIDKKYDLQEAQVRHKLEDWNVLADLDVLEFQRVGVPASNPRSQLEATTYLRTFVQAKQAASIQNLLKAWMYNGMAHFAGMHASWDMRTAMPVPFLVYFPGIISQSELEESVAFLGGAKHIVGPPKVTEPIGPRDNYDPVDPAELSSFGPTSDAPLGTIALARSGDKGANVNMGIFVSTDEEWQWLRAFLTRYRLQQLMGDDWRNSYFIERVEFSRIRAVHFVVYGPLGRGVSSSKLLDSLGKGFAEFIRSVHVPIPTAFLKKAGRSI